MVGLPLRRLFDQTGDMRVYFSWKISVTCAVLALLMARASLWQFGRYHEKQDYIREIEERLIQPPTPLTDLLPPIAPSSEDATWDSLSYRQVTVTGTFDFEHEVVLRNRRLEEQSGVFVLTPLKLANTEPPTYLLVSRGFIPLAKAERSLRSEFYGEPERSFSALVKTSVQPKFLAPQDSSSGPGLPWVDQWLRVDIPAIAAQLPYPLLPIYLELMDAPLTADSETSLETLVKDNILESKAGREEMFFLGAAKPLSGVSDIPSLAYPVPVYDTVIPPGRHFGYIFEWLFLSLLTLGIGLILQLRPPRRSNTGVPQTPRL